MKHYFFLPLCLLFLASFGHSQTVLSGKVTDDAGEVLIGSAVLVYKDSTFIIGAITDVDGVYRINLNPDTYEILVKYTGFVSEKKSAVVVEAGKMNRLNFSLHTDATLQELVIWDYKVPIVEMDAYSVAGSAADRLKSEKKQNPMKEATKPKQKEFTSEEIKNLPTKNITACFATTAGATSGDGHAPTIRGSRDEPTVYFIDGVKVYDSRVPAASGYETEESGPESAETHPATSTPAPRAGLLTAGEWNDLHNWNKHWVDLLADGELDQYMEQYGFKPRNRYTLWMHNKSGFPVIDEPVQLKDGKGNLLWEARTDNSGRAELWNGMYGEASAGAVYAFCRGKQLGALKPANKGDNHFIGTSECVDTPKNLDVVWVVDATGSMGDELEFLKTEVMDVVGRVQSTNPDLDIRTGTVFYRDQGDAYVTKSSALTGEIEKTVSFIRQQSADGGGDYPEALHTALVEAIEKQPWRSDAVARICFIVLDASPHQEPEVLESIRRTIQLAAQKGIRIVPVSGSGIQKDTEFLMKFFGLATNGSYAFLTDHSGIGGKHLEPTTDEYKMEALNDLLVRIITEYSTVPDCAGKTAIRLYDPQQQTPADTVPQAFIFPNPVREAFTLELPLEAQKVTLYDAEGQAVRNLEQLGAGRHRIEVNGLPAGFYTLRIWCSGGVQSAKVVVVTV